MGSWDRLAGWQDASIALQSHLYWLAQNEELDEAWLMEPPPSIMLMAVLELILLSLPADPESCTGAGVASNLSDDSCDTGLNILVVAVNASSPDRLLPLVI